MKELLVYITLADIPICGAAGAAAGGLWAQWQLNLSALLVAACLSGGYFLLSGFKWQRRAELYFSGVFLLLLVQASPLHFLAMHYLFSAHMVGHIVLLLLCGPLLVLGLPPHTHGAAAKLLSGVSRVGSRWPWLAWLCGVGVMWVWHIPAVFDAAFPSAAQMGFSLLPLWHMVSLLLAGMLFAWPVLGPDPQQRVNPLVGVVYLFTACIGCSLLGLLITFAPLGIYHHYLSADPYGFGAAIQQNWGITTAVDQQLAGLIMWVPCCFIYLSGSLYLLRQWLTAKEEQPQWAGQKYTLQKDTI